MAPEFKVTYKVKWADNSEPRDGSLKIHEPTSEKAVKTVERMIRRNVFEHYPQIIEINAERLKDINPQGNIFPMPGAVVAGRNDGMS